MKEIFDTHAHYDDSAFDEDRDELLKRLLSESVCGIVNQGTNVENSRFSLEMAEKYEGIYAAVGIHPELVSENSISELDEIRRLASHPKAVAIGEIGLDYYWEKENKEKQKELFIKQIDIANRLVDIANRPDTLINLGRNARNRYEKTFTSQIWVESFSEVFADVVRKYGK